MVAHFQRLRTPRGCAGRPHARGIWLVYRLNGENIGRNYYATLCRNRRSSGASLRWGRDSARLALLHRFRIPLGRFMGDLSSFSAHKLGSHVFGAAMDRAKLSPDGQVFAGNVLSAGLEHASTGRPRSQTTRREGATTINKVCGSGMKATMLAHDIINAGSAEMVLSGGIESMTNAPYLLAKARAGYRAGHDRIIDHMLMDGREDAYKAARSMGDFGEAGGEATAVAVERQPQSKR
jgi:acetyl-CoA acetyltransferase